MHFLVQFRGTRRASKSEPTSVHGRSRWMRVLASVAAPLLVGPVLVAAVTTVVIAGAATTAAASGVPFAPGDLLVSEVHGWVRHYSPGGALLDTLPTGAPSATAEAGSCLDTAHNVYVNDFDANDRQDTLRGDVSKLDSSGNLIKHPWVLPWASNPESCVVDNVGNVYVGTAGGSPPPVLQKFNANGTVLLNTWYPATEDRGVDWIDLAADQCTMYYSSEGSSILRFNVCTGTQMAPFATGLPGPCYALRIRPNGEVLVACADRVVRLDATGVVIATYTAASLGYNSALFQAATTASQVTTSTGLVGDAHPQYLFALDLDVDGTSFWVADSSVPYNAVASTVSRVDVATGAVLTQFKTNGDGLDLTVGGVRVVPYPGLSNPTGGPPAGGTLTSSMTLGAGGGAIKRCQCRSGQPVNDATGNFYHTFTDTTVPGRGLPLRLTRTFNSLAAGTSGPFGYGWSSSYTMNLGVDAVTGAVTVRQEDGATITFSPSGASYTAPPWVFATLIKNADGTFTLTRRARERFAFSAAGLLTSETDLNGYTTTLAYNASSQLVSVTDPAGRALSFTYGGNGLVSQATDPAGRHVSYGYDANSNLTSVTDVGGGITTFTYDASHRLLTMLDPNQQSLPAAQQHPLTNVYDANSRVSSQADPAGRATSYAYTPTGTTVTDPNGNVTVETYTAGELTQIVRASGTTSAATTTYRYDPNTLGVVWQQDPDGHISTATYDSHGNQTSQSDGLGRTTTATYDTLNDRTSLTDPSGVTTTYTFDAAGNPLSASRPLYGTATSQTTTYTYGDATHPGDVTAVTDPNTHTSRYSYDAAGNPSSAADPLGDTTTYAYDTAGRPTSIVSPNGNLTGANPAAYTTSLTYDAFGDLTSRTDPVGGRTAYVFDADRNLVSQTDPDGKTTTYSYDADNEPTRTTRPDGTTQASSYDNNGNLTAQTDGLGHATTYGYDPLNHTKTITDPLSRTTTNTYDPAGNRIAKLDPAGRTTTYSYDNANQLIATNYSDNLTPNVSYFYDADGRRTAMHDGTGATSYTYDSLGRLTSTTDGAGHLLGYSHDLAGNLTSLVYPTVKDLPIFANNTLTTLIAVTRSYDQANRLTSVADWLGNTTTFGYDADSNLTTQTYPNGTAAVQRFDPADHLTEIIHAATGAPDISFPSGSFSLGGLTMVPFLDFTYGRDSDGQVTADNLTGTPAGPTQDYTYDQNNRLTATVRPNATIGNQTADAYSYDAADNLTAIAHGPANAALTYDAANQLTTRTDTSTGLATHYTYDADGNRAAATTAAGTATYNYDQANRLASYSGPAATAFNSQQTTTSIHTNYTYNGDGLRGDLTWDVADGMPLIIGDTTGQLFITGPGGLPLELITAAGAVAYYHHDQLGSTRALTSPTGALLATYTYDPYGNPTPSTTTTANPFGYAGQYTDPETGLIYLRNRYYDPATATFLTRDPAVALTRAPYSYGADNPVNRTDPSGLVCANAGDPTTYDPAVDSSDCVQAGDNWATSGPPPPPPPAPSWMTRATWYAPLSGEVGGWSGLSPTVTMTEAQNWRIKYTYQTRDNADGSTCWRINATLQDKATTWLGWSLWNILGGPPTRWSNEGTQVVNSGSYTLLPTDTPGAHG